MSKNDKNKTKTKIKLIVEGVTNSNINSIKSYKII